MRFRQEYGTGDTMQVREDFDAIIDGALERAYDADMMYDFRDIPNFPRKRDVTAYFLHPASGIETTVSRYPLINTDPHNPLARLVASIPLAGQDMQSARALAERAGRPLFPFRQREELMSHRTTYMFIGENCVSRSCQKYKSPLGVSNWGPVLAKPMELPGLKLLLESSEPVAVLPSHLIPQVVAVNAGEADEDGLLDEDDLLDDSPEN